MTLDRCLAGTKGNVTELTAESRAILLKLMNLGIIPGASLYVVRHSPGILVKAGHTRIALDKRLAAYVLIKVTPV